jgi:hypothetical protein
MLTQKGFLAASGGVPLNSLIIDAALATKAAFSAK